MTRESKSPRHSPKGRERAGRIVKEHRAEHASGWATITSIAAKIGCKAETLRLRLRLHQAERVARTVIAEHPRARTPPIDYGEREWALAVFCIHAVKW